MNIVQEYSYSKPVYEKQWGRQMRRIASSCGLVSLCCLIVSFGGPLALRTAWPYVVVYVTGVGTLVSALAFALMSCFRIAQREAAQRQSVAILEDGTLLVRLVPKQGAERTAPIRYIEEILEYRSHCIDRLEIDDRYAVVFGQFTFLHTVNKSFGITLRDQKIVDCVKIPRVCGREEELFREISKMSGH